jgi:MoaA/NifB/PqqE/SkfB family radical SAM enzyme
MKTLSNAETMNNTREAMYLVTYGCDKACEYCFNDTFGYKRKVGSLIKEHHRLVEKLKQLNVNKVYVTGGEASIRHDIEDILRSLTTHFDVTLFTDGHLFKRFSPDQVEDFGVKSVNVSIDPFDVNFNETHRDQDEEFIPSFRLFHKIRKRTQVSILVTFSTLTVKYLPKFLQLDYIQSSDRVLFQPLSVPQQDLLYGLTLDSISPQEASNVIEEISSYSDDDYKAHLEILKRFYAHSDNLPPCQMGKTYLQIDPDGAVFGCPHNKSVMITENILQTPSKIILDKLNLAYEQEFSTNHCLQSKCLGMYSHLARRYSSIK